MEENGKFTAQLNRVYFSKFARVLWGNTIRGNKTRNSARKMALWEGLWEGAGRPLRGAFCDRFSNRDPKTCQNFSDLLPLFLLSLNISPILARLEEVIIQLLARCAWASFRPIKRVPGCSKQSATSATSDTHAHTHTPLPQRRSTTTLARATTNTTHTTPLKGRIVL